MKRAAVLQEENSKKLLLLAEAKRLADELKQFDKGICPTCGQPISGTKHTDRIKETWASR